MKSGRKKVTRPVGMEECSWAKVRFGIPPIAWTGGATAGTEDALIHAVQLGTVFFTLQDLLSDLCRGILSLQPRLHTLVLVVEVCHVHHQILHHKHVRQWRDRCGRRCILHFERKDEQISENVSCCHCQPGWQHSLHLHKFIYNCHLVLKFIHLVPISMSLGLICLYLYLIQIFHYGEAQRQKFLNVTSLIATAHKKQLSAYTGYNSHVPGFW
jgi:hypothetical protein